MVIAMKILRILLCLLLIFSLLGCTEDRATEVHEEIPEVSHTDTVPKTDAASPSEPIQAETAPDHTEPMILPEPDNEDFVKISDYIPDIYIDLRYATQNNFTGQIIYDFDTPWLRYGTVKKLIAVQDELSDLGFTLLIWDGFRPVSAQFRLWKICPDATYVANPYTGFSSHSRGNTVDLSILYSDGTHVEMPTDFDDFSQKADRNYNDCRLEVANNAQFLESIMEKHGFTGYYGEWWHYTDTQSYSVCDTFEPATDDMEGE